MRVVLAALTVALIATGCSSNNKVGDDSLLNVKDQVNPQLGKATTTIASTETSVALAIKSTTTLPPTTVPRNEVLISINGDSSGAEAQFTPNQAPTYAGEPVRWVNHDTKVRWIKFTEGSRARERSPDIAPGQSWAISFAVPGKVRYEDGTRPYAVGYITVVAK
ncbi:MAG TPA: hypothetical protein VFB78_12735 [Acidimicrobiales bacterium]|nr:hypothetical protein [Acidimicrobiales bacterium]